MLIAASVGCVMTVVCGQDIVKLYVITSCTPNVSMFFLVGVVKQSPGVLNVTLKLGAVPGLLYQQGEKSK